MIGRVATAPLSAVLTDGMARTSARIVGLQDQLASGKRATSYADLGLATGPTLSARTLLARAEAEGAAARAVETSMALADAHMTAIADSAATLRTAVLRAAGTGSGHGLPQEIEAAFASFRGALNAREGGVPIFGGAQADNDPFAPRTLAEAAATDPDAAFRNDGVRATARVGDGVDMAYGIGADEIGRGLLGAFRALAAAGPFGTQLTAAQRDALKGATDLLGDGLAELGAVQADTGRKRANLEVLSARADERANLLEALVSRHEDADLAGIAVELATRKTQLEASYSVFSQLSGLSLVRYLR